MMFCMQVFGAYLYHLNFFSSSILVLVLGLFVGLSSKNYNQYFSSKIYGLIGLLSYSLSFLCVQLFKQHSDVIDLTVIVSFLSVSLSIICASMLFSYRKFETPLPSILSFWVVSCIGMFVGMGFWVIGVILSCLVVGFLSVDQWVLPSESRFKTYSLTIDCAKLQVIEFVEEILDRFSIKVVEKSIIRGAMIHMEVYYKTAPLTQHLLLRRLLRLEGILKLSKR